MKSKFNLVIAFALLSTSFLAVALGRDISLRMWITNYVLIILNMLFYVVEIKHGKGNE